VQDAENKKLRSEIEILENQIDFIEKLKNQDLENLRV